MKQIKHPIIGITLILGIVLIGIIVGRVYAAANSDAHDEDHAGHDHAAEAEHSEEDHVEEGTEEHAGHDPAETEDHAEENPEEHAATEAPGEEDPHAGHAHGEEEEGLVALSKEERANIGLTIFPATTRSLTAALNLPGEVRLNEDRLAHVVPRLSGIVTEVFASVGDKVTAGQVLLMLDSRELADTKANVLASKARLALAEKTFQREKSLRDKQISAEKDYLEAQSALAECRITLRVAEQKLQALGIKEVEDTKGASLTSYEVKAPVDGEIIAKHVVLGEYLNGESEVFLLADLSTVWVDINVYQDKLPLIQKEQQVVLSSASGLPPNDGVISYLAPIVDRETRTALARVVLPNPNGLWRPGLFLEVQIAFHSPEDTVVIPMAAVQRMEEEHMVFVEDGDAFKTVTVTLGKENGGFVEILSGLKPGQGYVGKGAFELKAKLITSGMDPHAGHGH